jgi:hypothetical protein
MLALYSCHQLTLQLAWMRDTHHSYLGPPHTRQRVCLEEAQQGTIEPHAYPQQPQWNIGYEGGYSEYQGGSCSYYLHGLSGLSHGTGTSAYTRFPEWYYSLESYITYGANQAERVVEGVGRLKHTMGELRSSVDS